MGVWATLTFCCGARMNRFLKADASGWAGVESVRFALVCRECLAQTSPPQRVASRPDATVLYMRARKLSLVVHILLSTGVENVFFSLVSVSDRHGPWKQSVPSADAGVFKFEQPVDSMPARCVLAMQSDCTPGHQPHARAPIAGVDQEVHHDIFDKVRLFHCPPPRLQGSASGGGASRRLDGRRSPVLHHGREDLKVLA